MNLKINQLWSYCLHFLTWLQIEQPGKIKTALPRAWYSGIFSFVDFPTALWVKMMWTCIADIQKHEDKWIWGSGHWPGWLLLKTVRKAWIGIKGRIPKDECVIKISGRVREKKKKKSRLKVGIREDFVARVNSWGRNGHCDDFSHSEGRTSTCYFTCILITAPLSIYYFYVTGSWINS